MLSTLVESRRNRSRPGLGATVSAAVHAVLVVLAVQSSGVARSLPRAPEAIDIIYTPLLSRPLPRPATATRRSTGVGGEQRTEPVTPVPPVELRVPTTLPEPAVTIAIAPDEFGVARDVGAPRRPGGGADAGDVYSAGTVERVAVPLPGNPAPDYPAALRAAGIDGYVLARFVVDTGGRAERGSLRIIESSGEAFSASVRRVLPRLRFEPARVGTRKVRMLVEQSYVFRIER